MLHNYFQGKVIQIMEGSQAKALLENFPSVVLKVLF